MAQKDKDRYETEIKKMGGKLPKSMKEKSDKPKRGLSSYMIFGNHIRPILTKENPDLKITEIMKLIGEKWNALNDKEKKKYQDLAEKDKGRYEKQKKEYESTGKFHQADEDCEEDDTNDGDK